MTVPLEAIVKGSPGYFRFRAEEVRVIAFTMRPDSRITMLKVAEDYERLAVVIENFRGVDKIKWITKKSPTA